jgi:hypothetical protein
MTATCKDDVAFQKTYNFLTFGSKTFNGAYDIWTWNGTSFTRQKVRFPSAPETIDKTTEHVAATVNFKTYMTDQFVQLLIDNKMIVGKDRVFNAKNRYLDKIALQSVFMDANKVIG